MKKFTKLLGIVLIIALVMSMGTAAFAATITINQNNTEGTAGAESYRLFKIFDVTKVAGLTEPITDDDSIGVTVDPDTDTGFAYTISTSNDWFDVLGSVGTDGTWTAATNQTWVTLTQSASNPTVYTVTWEADGTAAAAKAFADFLRPYMETIDPDTTIVSSSGSASTTTEVDDGYWLIDSTLGTNLVLATSNITIETKNSYPSTEKEVAATNYNVGDMVQYTITVELPATVDYEKDITVHDTMDNVLSLITATTGDYAMSATVKAADAETATDFTSHVTLATGKTNEHDESAHEVGANQVGYDFVLDIDSLAPAAGATAKAQTITITYYAELLSTAAADTPYVNKEFVEYSKYTTPTKDIEVETYDIDINKIFNGATSDTTLEATFELYESVTTTTGAGTADEQTTTGKADDPIALIEETKYESYVRPDSDDTATTTTTITVKQGTVANVRGLKAGTYYLTETTTANGYNKLTDDIVVVIDADGNVTYTIGSDSGSDKIDVENNSGTVLPSTGGIGTTIFYVVGSILVVAAGVLLITKKRMSREG